MLAAFAQQAQWCRVPSPFSARLLDRGRAWLNAQPETLAALAAIDADPLAAAVALRWAGALHLLALRGLEPWSALWPRESAAESDASGQVLPGTDADLDARLDHAIAEAWRSRRPELNAALALAPQTNEVQRSAALLPGLLHVAAQTGLPLKLFEIGASAGLNLWCDRYRHEALASAPTTQHPAGSSWAWGDPQASVQLRTEWRGAPPAGLAAKLVVLERAACDRQPIDLAVPGEALRLASFIWPDQFERMRRLRSATAVVGAWMQADAVAVQSLPAAGFVERVLSRTCPGCCSVLMHSVVWQYVAAAEQRAISQAVEAAGAAATRAAPLAWLRFEPPTPQQRVELRCKLWPGGEDRLLARAHPHGSVIEWLASDALSGAADMSDPGAAART